MTLNIPSSEHLELDETLRRLGGDEEILRELFVVFGKDALNKLEGLKSAMESGDMPLVARWAHALKGACAVVGAVECMRMAVELEKTAESGPAEAVEVLFEPLKDEMQTVLELINQA